MKDQFRVIFVFSVLLVSTNEQCPLTAENSIISCKGSSIYGSNIYIDFYAIRRPCTCIALPSFDGELRITSVSGDINYECGTHIYVKNAIATYKFGCPIKSFSSVRLTVNINQSVDVRADYASPSTSGIFFHCIQLNRNGGLNGNLSIVCGSQLAADTTTKISTTTALSTTRLSSPTTAVLSMEPTSATSITDANIIYTTTAVLSKEADSPVSLQISLAIFVVISTISAILNIYFFIKIRLRNKSKTKKNNKSVMINHQKGIETNADTYTELGNTETGEPENQYDSISRQENYINMNIL